MYTYKTILNLFVLYSGVLYALATLNLNRANVWEKLLYIYACPLCASQKLQPV
jgi:hypothetical protein